MEDNLKILESWLGEYKRYHCTLSSVMGGCDKLDLSFNIVPKNYVPINQYGTYNEPYDSFKITISHLDTYTPEQMKELLDKINNEFKARV